jgi:hypothetical protein
MPIDLESGKFNPPPFLGNEKLEELVQKFPLTQEFIDAIQRDLGSVNSDLENYLPLTGGTLTGAVNFEGDVKVDDLPILSTVYSDKFTTETSNRWYKLNLPELSSGANHYRKFTVYAYTAFGNLHRFKEFEVYIVTRGSGAANGISIRILETVRGADINIPFYYKANGNGHDFYINLPNTYSGLRIDDHSNYVGGFISTRGGWSYSDTGPSSPTEYSPQEVFSAYSIEYGNNANGEYWKYPNGLLLCIRSPNVYVVSSIPYDAWFFNDTADLPFPHYFIYTPSVATVETNSARIAASSTASLTTTKCRVRLMASSVTAASYVGYIAIGRWK